MIRQLTQRECPRAQGLRDSLLRTVFENHEHVTPPVPRSRTTSIDLGGPGDLSDDHENSEHEGSRGYSSVGGTSSERAIHRFERLGRMATMHVLDQFTRPAHDSFDEGRGDENEEQDDSIGQEE